MKHKIKHAEGLVFYAAIIVIIIFQQRSFAQNDTGVKLNTKMDSSTVLHPKIFNPFLNYHLTNNFMPSINYNDDLNLTGTSSEDAWGISMARLRQSAFFFDEPGGNLKADLYMQNFLFKEKGLMATVRYFLGVASMSAAGYFAYKHIQKYGFIKDKK